MFFFRCVVDWAVDCYHYCFFLFHKQFCPEATTEWGYSIDLFALFVPYFVFIHSFFCHKWKYVKIHMRRWINYLFLQIKIVIIFSGIFHKITATIRDNRSTNPVNFQLTSKKVAIETEVTITDQKQKKITLCPFLWINSNILYIRHIFLKRKIRKKNLLI